MHTSINRQPLCRAEALLISIGRFRKWQQHVKKQKAVSGVGYRCDGVNKHMSVLASSKQTVVGVMSC